MLAALFATTPLGFDRWQRVLAISLIAVLSVANLWSLFGLVSAIVYHGKQLPGQELFNSSINIWATNIIIFALWYWELDRGGPDARLQREHDPPDFLFPQMVTPAAAPPQMVAALSRLPVRRVHERDRVQPDRHDAPDALGERPDAGPGARLYPDGDAGRRPRSQYSGLSRRGNQCGATAG